MGTLPSDSNWKYYGSKEPYFGVTGLDIHLTENLDDLVTEDFFQSGYIDVENLFSRIHAKIDPGFKPEKILDFGCGPGRMVIPFARYANAVTGMDVSQHMLEEAQKNCSKYNIRNVTFLLSDDGLTRIKDQKFDLVHSFIVIQHINKKRGRKIITHLLEAIKPGGIGVLQVTYHDAYPLRRIVNFFRYRLPFLYDVLNMSKRFVKTKKIRRLPLMQMNNYDLNKIFTLLQNNGVTDLDVSFTNHYDYWGVILSFKKK
jgi:ubiquinone/menaquinone biosynthesis C-methylase UbiE